MCNLLVDSIQMETPVVVDVSQEAVTEVDDESESSFEANANALECDDGC